MTKNELSENIMFLAALKMLDRLTAQGLLTAAEAEKAKLELEKKLRPTLVFT